MIVLSQAVGNYTPEVVHSNEEFAIAGVIGRRCKKASIRRTARVAVAGISELPQLVAGLIESQQTGFEIPD